MSKPHFAMSAASSETSETLSVNSDESTVNNAIRKVNKYRKIHTI